MNTPAKTGKAGRPKVRAVDRVNLSLKVEPELKTRFVGMARREALSLPVALGKLLSHWGA